MDGEFEADHFNAAHCPFWPLYISPKGRLWSSRQLQKVVYIPFVRQPKVILKEH
jgi:hypothetical protein